MSNERLSQWKACGDCSFIPVCGGGCSVAAHTELGDMHAPNCHKRSFEAGVVSLAEQAVLQLTADEQQELTRLLKAELMRAKS